MPLISNTSFTQQQKKCCALELDLLLTRHISATTSKHIHIYSFSPDMQLLELWHLMR